MMWPGTKQHLTPLLQTVTMSSVETIQTRWFMFFFLPPKIWSNTTPWENQSWIIRSRTFTNEMIPSNWEGETSSVPQEETSGLKGWNQPGRWKTAVHWMTTRCWWSFNVLSANGFTGLTKETYPSHHCWKLSIFILEVFSTPSRGTEVHFRNGGRSILKNKINQGSEHLYDWLHISSSEFMTLKYLTVTEQKMSFVSWPSCRKRFEVTSAVIKHKTPLLDVWTRTTLVDVLLSNHTNVNKAWRYEE